MSALTCSGTNRVAWAVAGSNNGAHCTGITYDGVAMVLIKQHVHIDISYVDIYRLINPPTSASDVVATWAAAQGGGAALIALVYTDEHQTVPEGTGVSEDGVGTSVTGAGGVSADSGDLTLDAVSWSSGGGPTLTATGTGHIKREEENPLGGWSLTVGEMTGVGTITPTWTISSSQDWSQAVVAMKAAAGGGGGGPASRNISTMRVPSLIM